MVRVRIAPSPTGTPHIGNTRTALFNFLFARAKGGKFILRIEDTDRKRLIPSSLTAIYEILDWLGLKPDEKYIQSERLEIYKDHVDELKEKGFVYQEEGALHFRVEKKGQTSWIDQVGSKKITFQNNTQEDFVIVKSDGFPTYNFANVVDDHLMNITHVIRGDEFISSTPKHIMLYQALGWQLPKFAHLPLLLGSDRTKLSKRHGAKSVLEFREEGYLREALINFMALLGWSPPSGKEILTHDEMVQEFDLKDINLSSPIFDVTKLTWFNKQWLMRKAQQPLEFAALVSRASVYSGKPEFFDNARGTASIVAPRIGTLQEYDNFIKPLYEEPKADNKLFVENYKEHINYALKVLENLDKWKEKAIGRVLNDLVSNKNFNKGNFFMNLRIAITGSRISLPINDLMFRLKKEEVIKRLKKII